jgi:hypothetical protein
MGNYVIAVGNYMIVSPSQLGNYKIADILANGGVPDGRKRDEDRFWIALGTPVPAAC